MAVNDIIFGDDRIAIVTSLDGRVSGRADFRVMIAPGSPMKRDALDRLVLPLVRAGCREIVCVGAQSEQLHDMVDDIVEDENALEVVTSWDTNLADGCWYFLRVVASPVGVVFTDRSDVADALRRAMTE